MLRIVLIFLSLCGWAQGQKPEPKASPSERAVASIETSELIGFDAYPAEVQRLIETGLALTKQNLTYTYGSADPGKGGMDCSGTIYYVLQKIGVLDVPRSASAQYVWTRKAGTFTAVISRKLDSVELEALRPGDLLFWTGTYEVAADPPVTHAMIYLGKRTRDGKPLMFGASNGRAYDGRAMWGVSVFDFRIPKARPLAKSATSAVPSGVFIGYAHIPGLNAKQGP